MQLTVIRTDARPVAVARIGLGVASVLNSIEAYEILARISSGKLATPVIEGVGTPTEPWLIAILILGVGAGVTVALGWRTEVAAALSASLNITVMLLDQQLYSSHRLLATLLLAFLLFADSDAAWSVRSVPNGRSVPWWPQLLMMNQLSICYLFAALSKLNPIFLTGAPLSVWVWIDLPWQIFTIAAVLTVAIELILAIGLWFPSSRRLSATLGLVLHVSIVVLMDHATLALVSFAITCVCLYPLFLHRPILRSRIDVAPEASAVAAGGTGAIN